MQIAGIKIKALIRQSIKESMIRNPKERTRGKAEKNKTEKPSITAKALITIPLPMVFRAILMAAE